MATEIRNAPQQGAVTCTMMPVADVKPALRNPRKHSAAQIKAIARSIEEFGFNAPILIDPRGRIVAGHGRLKGAQLNGLTHVPVICLDHLSDAQAKAYILADNKLTDRSSWDDRELALLLKDLSELTLDFDLEATGFETPELDLRLQSLSDFDSPDEDAFQVVEGPATTQLGDLWLLDDHRLLCGNALETEAYKVLLGTAQPTAVFTDPPYNVKIDGHVCGAGDTKHREFAMGVGEMDVEQFTTFLKTFLMQASASLVPGAVLFVCMDWRHMMEMLSAGTANDFDFLNLCVWVKTNGGMGSLYRSRHELVFVFRKGGATHRNNVQLGRHGRNRNNTWHYPGTNAFGGKLGYTRNLHPTVKPVTLVADAILDVTLRDDIVLDPFLGSGTTILAAERTGRRGYGIELDPLYVDTAIRRWQRLTRREARAACGQTFDELRKVRREA